jgi:hypothetical protein
MLDLRFSRRWYGLLECDATQFGDSPMFRGNIPPPCSISNGKASKSRSQWPRGLRHEMSSSARTLGSWVWIPLEACMFVCVYPVFMLSCVGSDLATGWSLVQGVLPTVYKCKITKPRKRRPRPDMGWSAIGWMDGWKASKKPAEADGELNWKRRWCVPLKHRALSKQHGVTTRRTDITGAITVKIRYLTTLPVYRLYSINNNMINEDGAIRGIKTGRVNSRSWEETCPRATCPLQNPTRTDVESNPGCCSGKPAIYCLRYGRPI